MTLPSRLRLKNGKKGLLGDIESALNVNGNQRIAQLECSASDPEAKQNYRVNGHGVNDDRLKDVTVEEDGDEIIKSDLDISLSSCDGVLSSSFTNLRTGSNHIFGAVESLRGGQEASEEEGVFEDDISYARKRRRFAGLTVVERSVFVAVGIHSVFLRVFILFLVVPDSRGKSMICSILLLIQLT